MIADASVSDPARAAPGFLEVTGGALLIGRVITFRGRGDALLDRWDAWADACGGELVLVPAHDLSRFGEYASFRGVFRVAVGAPVALAHADEGPSIGFDRGAILDAEAIAAARLDAERLGALEAALDADAARDLRTQRTRALLVPFGPIASAHLARGVLAPALSTPPRGLARIRGTDMRERPHPRVVHGQVIASACDWDIAEPVLDEPAAPGAYHVIPRYG